MLVVHHINIESTCTSPGPDNGAYASTGYKLNKLYTYKLKTASFPSYLSSAEVQAAIDAAFQTWDSRAGAALFANGGTTTAKINFQDGTNTIGFGPAGKGVVATTYGFVDRKTKVLKEADIVFSTSYTWDTNSGDTGDCGGDGADFDVRDVATHEAGHVVGLNDLTTTGMDAQTMNGYVSKGELFKRDLASGDLAGLAALWGP